MFWHASRSHYYSLALRPVHNLCAGLESSIGAGGVESTNNNFAIERVYDLILDGLIMVVEALFSAESPTVVKVPGRCCGNNFGTRCCCQLDGT